MAGTYVEVTDQSFGDKVLGSQEPVVVDFWAPWCRPCLMMAPTFEALSNDYQGKITFAKMNTDENMDTPGRLGIQGIPTLIIFRGGKEVDRIVGLVPREVFKRHLDAALGASV
jgi:thioredoxin 1